MRSKSIFPAAPAAALRHLVPLLFLLVAACGGTGGSTGGGSTGGGGGGSGGVTATLVSLTVTPANPAIKVGTSAQLIATGSYSDGSSRTVSSAVTWTSGTTAVATVTPDGIVSAATVGTSLITVTSNGVSASTTVTVTPPAGISFIYKFGAVPAAGGQPAVALMQASDGNFYGTAQAGGNPGCTVGCGTIFKITPAGVATGMHAFAATPTDGARPESALIQGKDGALYGTTAEGGAFGQGTVYRVALDGTYTTLYSFGAKPNDGAAPVAALVQGSDGDFYGTTSSGGANHCVQIPQAGGNCGTVFKVTAAGVETVLYSFGASASDGVEPTGALVQGNDGNFYGTTVNGGANACSNSGATHNCGTAFRVTPAGVATVLHSFGTGFMPGFLPTDGIAPQGGMILASDGNFYGTTPSGGQGRCGNTFGCGVVYRMTPAGTVTIAYTFSIDNVLNGYGPAPQLIQGRDGNLYGTARSGGQFQCTSCGTVFKLSPSGALTTLYSFGPLITNPSDPLSGVIEGSDGAFYGIIADFPNAGAAVFRLTV